MCLARGHFECVVVEDEFAKHCMAITEEQGLFMWMYFADYVS